MWATTMTINTFRQRQNDLHFSDDIFKCIFLNENISISIKISLKFVPKGQFNNYPSIGSDNSKPLSESTQKHVTANLGS